MPQAIFFDLDETLIRHSAPIMEQLQDVCHRHLAELSAARWEMFHDHLQGNVGLLWRNIAAFRGQCEAEFVKIFRDSLAHAGGDMALAEPMIEAFLAAVVESTGPNDGALDVLDRLADAGIATGIITNGFGFLQRRKVMAHGLAERVRFVLCSEDAGAHKPDARIFRMAMERVGADASGCWHVGDHRDNDVAGALNAGLTAVLFDPEYRVDVTPPKSVPYRVITRLTQIPELIAAL